MNAPVPSPTPTPVSAGVRYTTVGAVLLVATVAAVMSYAHMQHVAHREGEAWRSFLLPLSVDGLMVAASMMLLARRRAGLPGGVLPWAALLAGVGASLAANVAAAEPTTTARIVAAWPAVAFAVAFELLLQQRRPVATGPATSEASPESSDEPTPFESLPLTVVERRASTHELASGGTGVAGRPLDDKRLVNSEPLKPPSTSSFAPGPGQHVSDDNWLAARAAELIAEAGERPPGRRVLARELGCTEHRARVLLEALPTNAVSVNGTGPAAAGGPR